MLRNTCALLLAVFIGQVLSAEVVFTISQKGLKKDSVPEIIVGNFGDVIPTKPNDSTYQYVFNPEKPEYLFIVADKQSRWVTRLWITPEMKAAGITIDYTKRTVTPHTVNEWDVITKHVLDFQHSEQPSKADSIIQFYLKKDNNSYLSLWLLRFMTDKRNQLRLLENLGSKSKEYPEYKQVIANLTTRKYPNIGDTFTEFQLSDKNDSIVKTANIKNKWILLNFWSNSCGPCVKELDDFVKLYKSIDTTKIEFISIALDENKENWKKAKPTNKIIWTSVWSPDNVYCPLCLNYNLYSMPFFILFDNNKKLVFIKDGSDELENIKKALAEIK